MPRRIVQFEATPNPNALKCVLEAPLERAPRGYRSSEEVTDDPLADALFAIDGVAGLLIHQEWITVNRRPRAPWDAIKSAVRKAVAEHA